MFEALRDKLSKATNIGADIVPNFQQPEQPPMTKVPTQQPVEGPKFQSLLSKIQPQQATISEPAKEPGLFNRIIEGGKRTVKDIFQGGQPIIKPETLEFVRTKIEEFNIKSRYEYKQAMQDPAQAGFGTIPALGKTVLSDIALIMGEGIGQMSDFSIMKPTVQQTLNLGIGAMKSFGTVAFPGLTSALTTLSEAPITKDVMQFVFDAGNEQIVDFMRDKNILPGVDDATKRETLAFIRGGIVFRGMSRIMRPAPGTDIVPQGKNIKTQDVSNAINTLNPKPGETLNQAYRRNMMEVHPDRPGGSTQKAQEMNSAYKTLLDANVTEALSQVKTSKSFAQNMRDIFQKVKTEVQESFQRFKDDPSMASKVVDMQYTDMQGNIVPKPKNVKQYKEFAKGMLAGEIMSNEKIIDIQQGILKDATDTELERFKQEVAKIEAEEQRIGNMFGKKVGKQASTQQMKERESKKESLILEIMQYYNIDTNEAYDKYDELVDTPIDELMTTTERSQTQLQQIDEFLTNHKDITDPRAKQKLADVLDGKTVKDNGIDYNKEIEAIMERNLKPEPQQEDILDILDRMADKETPKPIVSEPTLKTPTQPEQKPVTKPTIKQEIPQQTIDRLVEKYKKMVSADLKVRLGKRAKQISPLLNKLISSLAYQPKQLDIKQAYGDPRILYEGIKLASDKNVLDKAEQEVVMEMMQDLVKNINKGSELKNQKGKPLTTQQKNAFLDMEDFRTPIKGIEDIKIKIKPIDEFLKNNPDTRLHIIESPRIPEKKPFAMMGTKETTYENVMKQAVMRALQQGAKSYIEPFGGVGTVFYHLPDYFQAGLEEAHINMFDIEKYTIVKSMQDGKMDVKTDVTNAYDTVIKDITDELLKNDEFRKTHEWITKETLLESKVGSKYFREMVMLAGFHPELAPRFFDEVMDGKLVKEGELTTTFKERLADDIRATIKEEQPDIATNDLEIAVEQAVENTLNKPGLYEKQYAELSEKIKSVLDRYDSDTYVDNINGDHNKALLTAIARHFRQRGVGGQRVISPSDGFSAIEGVLDKMVSTLGRYQRALDQYGDKINIYNQDGQEFINERAYELREAGTHEQSVRYFDPPYVMSNKMYLKNNPALKDALEGYSDYDKIQQIFQPAVGQNNTLMFTNDVDGKYFQSLKDLMGDRMTNDIYAYKENLTPTSFITTKNVSRGVNENGYTYYMLNNNAKIKNAVEFIDSLGKDIASKLKKNIAKVVSYMTTEMQKNAKKLQQIREGVVEAQAKLETLESMLDKTVTGKERQQLLSQAKAEAKKGYLTGKPLIKMIDTINRHLVNLRNKQIQLRKNMDKFTKNQNLDATTKDAFIKAFNQEYTLKKLTQEQQAKTKQKSIYSLDIDEVISLESSLKEITQLARTQKMETDKQKQERVEKIANDIRAKRESGEAKPMRSTRDKTIVSSDLRGIREALKEFSIKGRDYIDTQLLFTDNLFELTGFGGMKSNLDKANAKKIWMSESLIEPVREFIEKNKMTDDDMISVGAYGLAKRGDGLGRVKLFAYLTKIGDPMIQNTPLKRFKEKIANKLGATTYRPYSESEAKIMIERYQQDDFLTPKQKELYDMMREQFEKIHPEGAKTLLATDNKIAGHIEDYRPVASDYNLNKLEMDVEERNMRELNEDIIRKTKVSQTLDKKTTAKELIPLMRADQSFNRYMSNMIYYSTMQEAITESQKVVKELKEEMGDLLYNFFENPKSPRDGYFGRIINKGQKYFGNSGLGQLSAFFEMMIGRISKSVILGNPGTILIQGTNVFDAMMGGAHGNLTQTIKDLIVTHKMNPTKILNRSPFLTERHGQDRIQVIQNTFDDMIKGRIKKVEKIFEIGLNAIDMACGIVVNEMAYQHNIKQGMTPEEATIEADKTTKKAIGSFNPLDLPQINYRLTGPFAVLRMFSTFIQNRYNNIRIRALGANKTPRTRMKTIFGYLIAILMEAVIRVYVTDELLKLLGIKTSKKSFIKELGKNGLEGLLPMLNNIRSYMEYGDPITKSIQTVIKAPKKIAKGDTEMRAIVGDLIIAMGALSGVGGTLFLGRLIKGDSGKKKKSSKISSKSIKSKGISSETIR